MNIQWLKEPRDFRRGTGAGFLQLRFVADHSVELPSAARAWSAIATANPTIAIRRLATTNAAIS